MASKKYSQHNFYNNIQEHQQLPAQPPYDSTQYLPNVPFEEPSPVPPKPAQPYGAAGGQPTGAFESKNDTKSRSGDRGKPAEGFKSKIAVISLGTDDTNSDSMDDQQKKQCILECTEFKRKAASLGNAICSLGDAICRLFIMDQDSAEFRRKAARLAFVKKVFAILDIQLIITGAMISAFIFWRPLREYSARNEWMYITASSVTSALVFILGVVGKARREFPQNIILLLIYTVALSWMLGSIAGHFMAYEILIAVGIVAAYSIGMTIWGLQPRFDVTWCSGGIFTLSHNLVWFGIFCLIIKVRIAFIAYASIGAFLFSTWLLIDIQLMINGDHRYRIDHEEYIFAALNLYIDILNIFRRILIIVGLITKD